MISQIPTRRGLKWVAENPEGEVTEVPQDLWVEITEEEFERGGWTPDLHPVVSEIQTVFDFQNVYGVTRDPHYRFRQLRELRKKSQSLPINVVYFQSGIDSLNEQILATTTYFCQIVFSDDRPTRIPDGFTLSLIHLPTPIYLITNNPGYINFGKKFVLEVLNV